MHICFFRYIFTFLRARASTPNIASTVHKYMQPHTPPPKRPPTQFASRSLRLIKICARKCAHQRASARNALLPSHHRDARVSTSLSTSIFVSPAHTNHPPQPAIFLPVSTLCVCLCLGRDDSCKDSSYARPPADYARKSNKHYMFLFAFGLCRPRAPDPDENGSAPAHSRQTQKDNLKMTCISAQWRWCGLLCNCGYG